MKRITSVIWFIIVTLNVLSQAPSNKLWDYRFGGTDLEIPSVLIQTLDHCFLMGGYSKSSTGFDKTDPCRGNQDYWIVKTDNAGYRLWDKTFGGSSTDNLTAIIALPDSGFLLGGNSDSGISGDKSQPRHGSAYSFDYWIIRIDKNGNKLWDRTFGGDTADYCTSLLLLNDGNYLIGGYTLSDSTSDMSHHSYGNGDYWIIKIDPNGNKIWDKNYGGDQLDFFQTFILTPDNGILLGGGSASSAGAVRSQSSCNSTDEDYWIIKLDSNGVKLWDRSYGGPVEDNLSFIKILPGNKLLLCGTSNSGIGCEKTVINHGFANYINDYWLVCTDSVGNKLWDRVYGGNGSEDELSSVSFINNGVLLTGTSYSGISGDKSENNTLSIEQPWILALDTSFNKIWDKTLHEPTHTEECYGFQEDGGCFVFLSSADAAGGYNSQTRPTGYDYWLTKFCYSSILPTAVFTSSTNTLCQNACIDFTNNSQNATSYQWTFPGGTPSTDTSANPQGICYFNSGNFDVTLIATNSNGSDTLVHQNFLTIYPQVQFSPLTQHGDTLFSVQGYSSYQWYFGAAMINGATNYFYIAPQSGNYSVVVTDSNNCNATAQIINIIASSSELQTGTSDLKIIYSLGSVSLFINSTISSSSSIILTDILGRTRFSKDVFLEKGVNSFDLQTGILANGIYIIQIKNAKKSLSEKIFIK